MVKNIQVPPSTVKRSIDRIPPEANSTFCIFPDSLFVGRAFFVVAASKHQENESLWALIERRLELSHSHREPLQCRSQSIHPIVHILL